MTLVEISGLSVAYTSPAGPVYAADGVDLVIRDGESVGIAGESACGKSTLGLSIMRMLPTGRSGTARVGGRILFDGASVLDMDGSQFDAGYRWKRVSMIFQGAMNSLDPVFRIGEQFDEILRRHGPGGDGDPGSAVPDAVRSVGLDEGVLDMYPHELSGGMKQRAVIAMALLLKPDLVIADEPTTALDVLVQAQIINLLKALKRGGTSVMLITHDLAVLSEIADRIGIMYGGQMVEFGAAEEIYRNPLHPYTRGLLESIPTLGGDTAPRYIGGSPPSLLDAPTRCRFLDRCPHAAEKCLQVPPKTRTDTGYVRCWMHEEGWDGQAGDGAGGGGADDTLISIRGH